LNGTFLDKEFESKLHQFQETVHTIETRYADDYAQRQLSHIMKSIYLESKISEASLSQVFPEKEGVPHSPG